MCVFRRLWPRWHARRDGLSMSRYWLASHAYAAVIGPQTVFFDSKAASFFALRTGWVYSLRRVLSDWDMPVTEYCQDDAEIVPSTEVANLLTKRGLLTTVASEGKRMEQVRLDEVRHLSIDWTAVRHTRVGLRDIAYLITSAAIATRRFRRTPLSTLLEELGRQRIQCDRKRPTPSESEISNLVCVYWRLRPFLAYGRHTDLIDSLTLIEYLSRRSFVPRLVIGVQLLPFSTHAWVQAGSAVFNDTPEFVRQFTPIVAG